MRRPLWLPFAGLLAATVASTLAALAVALLGAALGARDLTPPVLLVTVLVAGAAALGAVLWLDRVTGARGVGVADLGLRRPASETARGGLLLAGAALLLAGGLAAALDDVSVALPHELSRQPAVDRASGLPDPTAVALDLDTILSVLARAVVGVVVAEAILRGFVLRTLVTRVRTSVAIGVVTVLSAFTPLSAGELGLAVPAMVLSAVLCVVFLETGGSIALTAAATAAAQGVLLGEAFGWTAPESAALALVCAVLAAGPMVLGPRPTSKMVPPPLAGPSSRP